VSEKQDPVTEDEETELLAISQQMWKCAQVFLQQVVLQYIAATHCCNTHCNTLLQHTAATNTAIHALQYTADSRLSAAGSAATHCCSTHCNTLLQHAL